MNAEGRCDGRDMRRTLDQKTQQPEVQWGEAAQIPRRREEHRGPQVVQGRAQSSAVTRTSRP